MELHERCRAYVVSAMDLLRSRVKIESHPNVLHVTPAGILEDSVFSPLFNDFVSKQWTDVRQLLEFGACLEIMRNDATISRHTDQSIDTLIGTFQRTVEDYLYILLRGQFSEYPNHIEFDSERFEEQYLDLEQFFYTDHMKVKVVIPISNFEMEPDEVTLNREVKIRRISEGELREIMIESEFHDILLESDEDISMEDDLLDQIPWENFSNTSFVIEITHEMEKGLKGSRTSNLARYDEEEESKKLLMAMKLFKQGAPNISIIKTTIPVHFPATPNTYRGIRDFRTIKGPIYSLMNAEIEDLRRLWLAFRKTDLQENASLALAVKRFSYAYERERIEEKMIDYLVAFEALLIRGEQSTDLTHRLTTRVARLVAQTYEDRKRIAQEMKTFYGIRSRIVHGQEVSVSETVVSEAERLLRKAIGRLLEQLETRTYDEIISYLDFGED